MRLLSILLVGCGSAAPPAAPTTTPPIARAPTEVVDRVPGVVAPVACTRGTAVQYLSRTADRTRAIACLRAEAATTDCWSIDPATGSATQLARDGWPVDHDAIYPIGDALPQTTDDHHIAIRVRAPRTIAFDGTVVETCASAGVGCKRVTLRAQAKRTHVLGRIAVSDDGALLTAGFGTEVAGDARTELYDVATGKFRTALEIKMPRVACTDVIGFPAGNILVQTTDCANFGGVRVAMNPKGGWLATLGDFASAAPMFDLGGDRWLLVGAELSIWSFAKPQRLAIRPEAPRMITVAGGAILGVGDDGAITSYATTDLATTALGAIPACRKGDR